MRVGLATTLGDVGLALGTRTGVDAVEGVRVGTALGIGVGGLLGCSDGAGVGLAASNEGPAVGDVVGRMVSVVGGADGDTLGGSVEPVIGAKDGKALGLSEGKGVGGREGTALGCGLGIADGAIDGLRDGAGVGLPSLKVGEDEGTAEGTVGAGVG